MQLNKSILTLLIASVACQTISDENNSRSQSNTDLSNNSDNSFPTIIDDSSTDVNNFISNIISQFSLTPTPSSDSVTSSTDSSDVTNLSPTDSTDSSSFDSASSTSSSSNDSSSSSDSLTETRLRSSISSGDNSFTSIASQRSGSGSTVTNTSSNSLDNLNSSSTINYTYIPFVVVALFTWLN